MRGRKIIRPVIYIILAVLVIFQFIPITLDNPSVQADFDGPPDVRDILKRSCYDCHSNETAWPWYSYVAPVSWMVAGDVHEARSRLNFSDWGMLAPVDKRVAGKNIWGQVKRGDMPLSQYLLMHPAAKLTEPDKSVIQGWSEGTPAKADSI